MGGGKMKYMKVGHEPKRYERYDKIKATERKERL
jgi:hypothetical protein